MCRLLRSLQLKQNLCSLQSLKPIKFKRPARSEYKNKAYATLFQNLLFKSNFNDSFKINHLHFSSLFNSLPSRDPDTTASFASAWRPPTSSPQQLPRIRSIVAATVWDCPTVIPGRSTSSWVPCLPEKPRRSSVVSDPKATMAGSPF